MLIKGDIEKWERGELSEDNKEDRRCAMNRHRAYWSNMSDHPNPDNAEIGDRHRKRYERLKTQVELLVEMHGFDKVAQCMREIHKSGDYNKGSQF